jgi:NAD(P) transhydrogenase subunit alpha
MSQQLLIELTVFILAVFVGIEVIGKVPTTLHTPLMSATNAIHGIVLVGAILVAGQADAYLASPWKEIIGVILVIFASLNVFGGYTVTERMLEMFKPRAKAVPTDVNGTPQA